VEGLEWTRQGNEDLLGSEREVRRIEQEEQQVHRIAVAVEGAERRIAVAVVEHHTAAVVGVRHTVVEEERHTAAAEEVHRIAAEVEGHHTGCLRVGEHHSRIVSDRAGIDRAAGPIDPVAEQERHKLLGVVLDHKAPGMEVHHSSVEVEVRYIHLVVVVDNCYSRT